MALYTHWLVLRKAAWGPRPGCAHLSRSLILTAAAAAQPQQKAGMQLWSSQWPARIAHAQVEDDGRKSGVVSRSEYYRRSMAGRVVIEDGISDASMIEAVAISADSLPQTFFLEQISDLIAGIISLKKALVMPIAKSPVGGPPAACLPEGAQ